MTPTIYKYEKSEDLAQDAASAMEDMILFKLSENETVRIALSGGGSPKEAYERLSKSTEIDWSKVEFFLVDERCVPSHSSDSNYNLIEQTLLRSLPDIKAFHSFDTSLLPEEAAQEYDEILRQQGSPLFDLVVLGLGEDGHTASLFPNTPALREEKKWAVHTLAKKQVIKKRLTLTFPALLSSDRVMFIVQGKDKKEIVEKWLNGNDSVEKIPAVRMLLHPHVEVYLHL